MIPWRIIAFLSLCSSPFILEQFAFAQASSNLTNSAAPSASVSTLTNGGTNINQQVNNAFDTSLGFGPGVICRSPSFFVNGSYGNQNNSVNTTPVPSGNFTNGNSYTATAGIVVPFGSSTITSCEQFANQIVLDRKISTELSLIRACASLQIDRLKINPEKFPLLATCLEPVVNLPPVTPPPAPPAPSPIKPPVSPPQPTPKVIQRFNP